MSLLRVEGLVSGYADLEIIHGVSLKVKKKEIITIIGPNGAGKSTLIKAIFGVIDRWDGDVYFDGQRITGLKPRQLAKRGVSYVPQTENVFPSLTVEENLKMGAEVLDKVQDQAYENVYELFPRLRERKSQMVGTLSGGERQMVAMGRALITDPEVLLIDEPTAGLAPELVDTVFDRIQRINENGTAILMVEQNARAALETSHRGYVLDRGENRFEGPSDELLDNDDVIQLYLGDTG